MERLAEVVLGYLLEVRRRLEYPSIPPGIYEHHKSIRGTHKYVKGILSGRTTKRGGGGTPPGTTKEEKYFFK